MIARNPGRALALAVSLGLTVFAASADASTGLCDVSPGEYTAYTGADPIADKSDPASTSGLSEARCLKTIRTLGSVVEGVFLDAKGRHADELPSYGKLFDMWPGELGNTICNGFFAKGQRNVPSVQCVSGWGRSFSELTTYGNALDWKYINPTRYDPAGRVECAVRGSGCFGGRCYDPSCVQPDGTLMTCAGGQICKSGACVTGDPATLPTCTTLDNPARIGDGDGRFYNPWDHLVFDMGGLANKVAIFAVNDHGPQPCESNEYTVYLTNDPFSRELVDNPGKTGADPSKWNRAKLFKVFTHGWTDNPDCCSSTTDPLGSVKGCDPSCAMPKAGDPPNLEADSMALVFSLPCGIAFRYATFIAGYDGKSLTDPAAGPDACHYDSFDAEIDAVAGLNDDESAICPDKDGDGFPTCDCTPKPDPCDCVDDPAKDPDAKKYHPGAPQACDGPQYSCAATPCAPGTVCAAHQCLKPCAPGEFKCSSGFSCQHVAVAGGDDAGVDAAAGSADLCVPAACGDAGVCDPGLACVDGKCVDPCGPPTKCPYGQLCQDGKCKDPCALIKCPAGQTCQNGGCHDNCACLAKSAKDYPCGGATPTCDSKSGLCDPAGCDTTTCAAGQHCESVAGVPTCKGPCDGVVCPKGQSCDDKRGCVTPCDLRATPCAAPTVCKDGACVDPECAAVDCVAPLVCKKGTCVDPSAGDGGICLTCDAGGTDADFDASGGDTSIGDDENALGASDTGAPSSCGCETPGAGTAGAGAMIGAVALLGLVASRRRRR